MFCNSRTLSNVTIALHATDGDGTWQSAEIRRVLSLVQRRSSGDAMHKQSWSHDGNAQAPRRTMSLYESKTIIETGAGQGSGTIIKAGARRGAGCSSSENESENESQNESHSESQSESQSQSQSQNRRLSVGFINVVCRGFQVESVRWR